jgi:hypothetical protein
MSSLTHDLILKALTYRDEIVRQTNRKAVLFSMLPKRPALRERAYIGVETGGATASAYTEGDTFGTPTNDTQTSIPLVLAMKDSDFGITDLTSAVARVNKVPGNTDQFMRQLINASGTLAKTINIDLFSGVGIGSTNAIIGLDVWCDDSNTVGGVDRSSDEYWQASVFDGSSTAITKKVLYNDLATIANVCGESPNLAVCNPLVFAQIQALYDGNIQYTADFSSITGYPALGGARIPVIEVNGCTFISDSDGYADSGPGGKVYYLNTDHVWIETLQEQLETAQGILATFQEIGIPGYEGPGTLSTFEAGFTYKPVAKTGHFKNGNVSVVMQLCCDKPNCLGVRTNVSLATA